MLKKLRKYKKKPLLSITVKRALILRTVKKPLLLEEKKNSLRTVKKFKCSSSIKTM